MTTSFLGWTMIAGATLLAQVGNGTLTGTIVDGQGLNITVHSYLDELEFGLIACRELVPDLWHMIDLHVAEIDVLADAAGVDRPATPPTPIKRAAGKRTSTKRAAAKRPAKKATARKAATPRKRTVKKSTARSA